MFKALNHVIIEKADVVKNRHSQSDLTDLSDQSDQSTMGL